MSDTIATYTFLPWLREGIANNITATDGDPSVSLRADINVSLKITGNALNGGTLEETISQDVQLYGPGDIVGIGSTAIIKSEPLNYITNFEPNYLPYVDFYDEDFPWRYTPAAPDTAKDRLRPWIALVILKEDEFTNGTNVLNRPLNYIDVTDPYTSFPPADQLWAWGHVHINQGMMDDIVASSGDKATVLSNFEALLDDDPDLAYARLICPRKLEANTAYHAFVVPVFESGRLAGLGLDPSLTPKASHSAWEQTNYSGKSEPTYFPYYHRWYFRAGSEGDFEYLVRLLEPKPVDARVGTRDMDVQAPGANLPGITDTDLNGILRLGGALRIPYDSLSTADQADFDKYDQWASPYPHTFQTSLSEFLNLPDDYSQNSAVTANSATSLPTEIQSDPDPLITAPIYGKWHALVTRVLKEADGTNSPNNSNWVHDLNLDPRHRVAAGFGTTVIQENQEKYINEAWGQVGEILEANRQTRLAQLAKASSQVWYDQAILTSAAVSPDRLLTMTSQMHQRVIAGTSSVKYQFKGSLVPSAITSPTLRRITRPGGRVAKSLPYDTELTTNNFISRVNDELVTVVAKKTIPEDMPTGDQLANDLSQGAGQIAEFFREESLTPNAVETLPTSPNFRISFYGDDPQQLESGPFDSPDAEKYKQGLRDAFNLIVESRDLGSVEAKPRLSISTLASEMMEKIDPGLTIPRYLYSRVTIPGHLLALFSETFVEAMAYPEFDWPMYKPLVKISEELFLPNINLIPQNSMSLLETNQKFIEAYMVGLNHEFARELLWREYPTDQRGSYFRQFWDVVSYYETDQGLSEDSVRESLRDIPPIHKWSKYSDLGEHDNRDAGGTQEEEVVLVIRGELLKKYPNAVIYAHKAEWQLDSGGQIDTSKERRLVALTPTEQANPPLSKVKTPVYEAKVSPDIYFFGFDLTTEEAQGASGADPGDINKAGWFFVIKERPGEPRFGLDIGQDPTPNVWNDLSWEDVVPGASGGEFIEITSSTPTINLIQPTSPADAEKVDQWDEDKHVSWNKNMNSAELAYVLYQVPVLVAIHAVEMLPE